MDPFLETPIWCYPLVISLKNFAAHIDTLVRPCTFLSVCMSLPLSGEGQDECFNFPVNSNDAHVIINPLTNKWLTAFTVDCYYMMNERTEHPTILSYCTGPSSACNELVLTAKKDLIIIVLIILSGT